MSAKKRVAALAGETVGGLGMAPSGCFKEGWAALDAAVARVYRKGTTLTADQGGKASTKEFGRAVLEAYRAR